MTSRDEAQDILPSSFRDRSAFVFRRNGAILRQINSVFEADYVHLMGSGLYGCLVERGLLIAHDELDGDSTPAAGAYKIIRPEPISFISYPYEWCFSQLRDAALATLRIQMEALEHGMSLKDCSGYNMQFRHGKPILIDTSSFEKYRAGLPWIAYGQFCRHFLAPLALMSYVDLRLGQLLRVHIDGVPLDLAASLLPVRARLRAGLLIHLFAHGACSKHFSRRTIKKEALVGTVGPVSLRGLIESLRRTIESMSCSPGRSEWSDYDGRASYDNTSFEHKNQLVAEYIDAIRPSNAWDLGGNTGVFSRVVSGKGIDTVSMDADPVCVERNYLQVKRDREERLLPLVVDLTNPSPGIGWGNRERASLTERGPTDVALVLAVIHHLAISNNVPFDCIARFLHDLSKAVIIEFVPKTDSLVQGMLSRRDDVFEEYTQDNFVEAFRKYFSLVRSCGIKGSGRVLYLMGDGGSQ